MKLKRHDNYRPVEFPWLKEVPSHWATKRLKHLLSSEQIGIKIGPFGSALKSELLSENGAYKVYGQENVISRDFQAGGRRLDADTYQELKDYETQPGDILVTMMGSSGRCCEVPEDIESGIMDSHLLRIRLEDKQQNRLIERLVDQAPYVRTQIELMGKGAIMHGINSQIVKNLVFHLPPIEEQHEIRIFLDRETAKIDALIAEQQRLIKLLQEKRQAVISHAVTKGLNPNVPMKDSGVEWLGEVPEHWNLLRGRFLYTKREEATQNSDEVVTAFRDGQVIQRNLRRVDGFTLAELEVGYQHVCIGDLVIHGMDAFAGAIGVSESEGKCTPEYSVCYPIDSSHSNTYFAHALRVMAKREYIYVICPSVRERAPRFRFNTFKDVVLPVPPSAEQESISKSITYECSRLSELVSSAEALMAVLKERRSALISAAVTGQIDVRGLLEAEAGEQ